MPASITAESVCVEYPILQTTDRSLKRRFVSAATGGRVARDARDHIVVTALSDVSFEINEGERVALVGHNGSGKTTMLRSIAGIYEPARGKLSVKGSISTLFDIYMGFDSEATGRENVILRGLVMGLTRAQIMERMEDIREFSGLGDYLELPSRTYSSGMQLRLAFAVATSIEREIVLMDEWLSVGDAEFKERAQRRLHDHLQRTAILVIATHSEELVQKVCTRRIELNKGRIVADERLDAPRAGVPYRQLVAAATGSSPGAETPLNRSQHRPRKKGVAVIVATPPSFNPGMAVSDATARSFIRRAGLASDTRFFRLLGLDQRLQGLDDERRNAILTQADVGITYEIFESPAQLEDYVPVFWGDFLHMPRYIRAIAASAGDATIGDRARGLFLLQDAPESLLGRTVTFGTSFLFNATADYLDPLYGSLLERLLASAHHVQMRDAVSAAMASTLRQKDENCFGVDAVQLIANDECAADVLGDALSSAESSDSSRRKASVFVARGRHDTEHLQQFLAEIARELDVTLEWLPWGDERSFPWGEALDNALGLRRGTSACPRIPELLQSVRSSCLVITDTYHVAVSSWALGVPAVMLPGTFFDRERTGKSLDSLARHDKRKVFYAQDGLMDFFIEAPFLQDAKNRSAIVARLAQMVSSGAAVSWHHKLLDARCKSSEARLSRAIHGQLVDVVS